MKKDIENKFDIICQKAFVKERAIIIGAVI